MKTFIYLILWALLLVLTACMVVYGIDIHVARDDYMRAKENGNYEQAITGCIFDWVCDRYSKELQK